MRKRLQKKRRLGPYQELRFQVALTANPTGDHDWDQFFKDFLSTIESLDLRCGDASGAQIIIEAGRRANSPDQKRQAILDWLHNRNEIAAAHASELYDARRLIKK